MEKQFQLISMSGDLIPRNILFMYIDIESKGLFLIEDVDGVYIVYELRMDQEKYVPASFFGKHKVVMRNIAIWCGEANDIVVENGINAEYGKTFIGAENSMKVKLTVGEINQFLEKQYHFEA